MKKKILLVFLLLAQAILLYAQTVTYSFTVPQSYDDRVTRARLKQNAFRAVRNLSTYVDNNTFAKDVCQEGMKPYLAAADDDDRIAFCNWWNTTATTPQKTARCTDAGRSSDCNPCP